MSTSLPKIKTLADNSDVGSQKQLKFKKLKLSTDQSAADIRQKFKSVRTERLNSLQRYSTVQGQRQYKKQKIHLNLLQRKLLSGTYDQAKQTGNDLNELKQKKDYYKIQSAQKQVEAEKMQRMIQLIKLQIDGFELIKKKYEDQILKSQKKYEQQKLKTQCLLYQRGSLELMIDQRKKINIFLQSQVNEQKAYLTNLKSIMKQVDNEARESNQNMKNLMAKIEKINQDISREQKQREQFIFQKQTTVNKRKQDQKLREDKSREYKKSLDEAQQQAQYKDFSDLYKGILANLFVRKYNHITFEDLQNKYQIVENYYNQICSYQKFSKEQPQQMVVRFSELKPQTNSYSQKIEKLQKQQTELQQKNQILENKLKQFSINSSKSNESSHIKLDQIQIQQKKQKNHEKKLESIRQQTKNIERIYFKIAKWSQRYANQFQIKTKKSQTSQDITLNMLNILKVLQSQAQNIYNKTDKINTSQ